MQASSNGGVALELSKDPVGLQEILDKADVHSLNEKAFSLPSRLIAKIYLFRTIFRGSGWSFANDPDFMHVSSSPSYWEEINEKFYDKYKGLDQCHKRWADCVVQGHPIVGPLGRFWPIDMGRDKRGELKIPWTVLTNYPVQGTAADVMTIARISFYSRLRKLVSQTVPEYPLLVSSVHDSVVVDAPEKWLKTITGLFYKVFDDIPENIRRIFGYNWKVPLGCEVKFGPNMKEMTKIDRQDL